MKTMNTNVSIALTEEERDSIATVIDGKFTKRLATRADIVELVTKFVGGFVAEAGYKSGKVTNFELARDNPDPKLRRDVPHSELHHLYRIREGEAAMLKGKSDSYIRGWNSARTDGR
jgi:hypothetical protein